MTVTSSTSTIATELREKIESHTALVGIMGLGYVGLPLALTFSEKRFPVLGFDVDPAKIEDLNAGRNYIKHLDAGRLAAAAGTDGLLDSAQYQALLT